MHVIECDNVNTALHHGLIYLADHGIKEPSRNGPVLVAPGPVTTVYHKPWQRVLFSPLRDANPFFHLMEALWMLAGRNDLEFPRYFNSNFGSYSDDGVVVHGAYGHRWREWFGYDQLTEIVTELQRNPSSRRCVLAMWDGTECDDPDGYVPRRKSDLKIAFADGKDVPCNTHAYFDCRGGKLNMTVCCRSNDIWWGAYGANAVHFSILQEYVADRIGVPMGLYYQVSNNFHLYTSVVPEERLREYANDALHYNYYSDSPLFRLQCADFQPLQWVQMGHQENWTQWHVNRFIETRGRETHNFFLETIAGPMYAAYILRKEKAGTGMEHILRMPANNDWHIACKEWINRRNQKKERAANA